MTRLQIIDNEIAYKGECYIICLKYDAADFDITLAGACDGAAACGATQLYFAMRDEARPLTADAYTLGGRLFRFDTNYVLMQKPLPETRATDAPLRMKRIHAGNDALFGAIYNEAFFQMANSRTMENAEMEAIEANPKRDAGFFMEGGEPVGVFALDYREDIPEIAAIAVREEFRNRGYGRRALHTLEMRLAGEGYGCVQLLVAESNAAAYGLYRAEGYNYLRTLSRWYRARL